MTELQDLYMCTTYSNRLFKMLTIVFVLSVKKTADNFCLHFFFQKPVDNCLGFFCWKTVDNCLWMRDQKSCVFNKFSFVFLNDLFLETFFTNWNHQTLRNFLNASLGKYIYHLSHFDCPLKRAISISPPVNFFLIVRLKWTIHLQ